MSTLTTTPYSLPYPDGNEFVKNGDNAIAALAAAVAAKLTPHTSGPIASRPTSTVGTPGVLGRTYTATDQGPSGAGGITYRDLGTSWLQIAGAEVPHAINGTGEPLFGVGWSSSGLMARFWKDATGRVHLAGTASNSDASASLTIFQLPTGYRPTLTHTQGIGRTNGSSTQITLLTITTGGNVTVPDVPFASSPHWFDGVSFDPAR